mmetsp:Transcript_35669/g.54578  ORF Transcript_35669/g.54578 Transcript_35669/m.54578 type:complete len:88 (+) Transcript_35669:73-336(+)
MSIQLFGVEGAPDYERVTLVSAESTYFTGRMVHGKFYDRKFSIVFASEAGTFSSTLAAMKPPRPEELRADSSGDALTEFSKGLINKR